MATQQHRPLAVITGASTGIGRELARIAAREVHNLVSAADEPGIERVAAELRTKGAEVDAVDGDFATRAGVKTLIRAMRDRTGTL